MAAMLAALILAVHLAIILFNVIGLVIITIGAWRGWRFVHAPVWRLLHIASWTIVPLRRCYGNAAAPVDLTYNPHPAPIGVNH
jgi:hypothetical protein